MFYMNQNGYVFNGKSVVKEHVFSNLFFPSISFLELSYSRDSCGHDVELSHETSAYKREGSKNLLDENRRDVHEYVSFKKREVNSQLDALS